MHFRDTTGRGDPGESSSRRSRRRRRGTLGGLTGLLALLLIALAAPSASAQSWECDAFGYLFQYYGPEETDNAIVQVDLATGSQTPVAIPPGPINAAGYNIQDNYFYAFTRVNKENNEWEMARVHKDGSVDLLGNPLSGAPTGTAVGDIDPDGYYWTLVGVTGSTSNYEWQKIDLVPGSATYGEVVDFGEAAEPAPLTSVGADWAWVDGALYSVGGDAEGDHYLVRFDPATGSFATVGGVLPPPYPTGTDGNIGAIFADASGYLYASANATNTVWRIDPNTLEVIESAPPPEGVTQSPGNDGARCAAAVVPTITVTKTVEGRVRPADQFTVGVRRPDNSLADSATTTGAQTTASTTNVPASEGKTFTLTDAMAPGSPSALGEYVSSIVCTNADGAVVPTGGSGPNWTLLVAEPTFYTCNITNKAVSDLGLIKESAPSPVVPGEEATFSLKVSNKGPSASLGETITDQLPKEFKFISATEGCAEANGVVTCQVGELAPGASRTFGINGEVDSSLDHCLENTATVSGAYDPYIVDNSASDCAEIEGRIDLSIEKTPSHDLVAINSQVTYTLVIENDGPSDATGVRVTDPLAAGLTLVAVNPSQGKCPGPGVVCTLGYLAAGGSAQIQVTAQTGPKAGVIINTATVRGDQVEINPDNNQDSARINVPAVPPPPGFELETRKKSNTAKPFVGQPVHFRIVVANRGPAAAPSVQFTDTLNAPSRRISVKPSAGSCEKGLPLKCDLGTIAAGEKVTIKVVLKPLRSGCFQRNAASATGAGTDLNPNNNMDVVKLCVKKVKLKVTKTANRSSVPAGGKLRYTIRVKNLTKGAAKQVRVCDNLPNGMAFAGSSPKGKLRSGRLCWQIKQLGPKASKRFRVVARALKGSSGRKVNRATANSPDARAAAKAKRAVRVNGRGASPAGGVTG